MSVDTQDFPSKLWYIGKGRWRFGYSSETVGLRDCPYLHRKILWLGLWTLRYHVFYSSDEERALHDHPWAFITFPLNMYLEHYYHETSPTLNGVFLRKVLPWRFHYRSKKFRHRVLLPEKAVSPVRTLIFTFPKKGSWGFWKDGEFYHWKKWFGIFGMPPCKDD